MVKSRGHLIAMNAGELQFLDNWQGLVSIAHVALLSHVLGHVSWLSLVSHGLWMLLSMFAYFEHCGCMPKIASFAIIKA